MDNIQSIRVEALEISFRQNKTIKLPQLPNTYTSVFENTSTKLSYIYQIMCTLTYNVWHGTRIVQCIRDSTATSTTTSSL